jgi:hypothetical protein
VPIVRLAAAAAASTTEEAAGPAERGVSVPAAVTEPAIQADLRYVGLAYVLVIGGAFAGRGVWYLTHHPTISVIAGVSVFAPLYIFAQSIERVLEPFSTMVGRAGGARKSDAVRKRDEAIVARDAGECAKWQKTLDQIRRNTAVLTWGLASLLGMLASGAFGILMLHMVGFHDVRPFWDITVTGLAIGSGTKPLHDLISNIQKAKENREDPPETGGTGN